MVKLQWVYNEYETNTPLFTVFPGLPKLLTATFVKLFNLHYARRSRDREIRRAALALAQTVFTEFVRVSRKLLTQKRRYEQVLLGKSNTKAIFETAPTFLLHTKVPSVESYATLRPRTCDSCVSITFTVTCTPNFCAFRTYDRRKKLLCLSRRLPCCRVGTKRILAC